MIGNPLQPGSNNAQLEADLETLPDEVSTVLMNWRIATLNRERVESLLHARLRADTTRTMADIKSSINGDPDRYEAVLNEIKAEAEHTRLLERLLCAKKLASLRTAF